MLHDIHLKLTDLQVEQLRTLLDYAPLRPYAPLIATILPALPFIESAADSQPGTDSSPAAPRVPGFAGGFQLMAFTQRGRQATPELVAKLEEWFGPNELGY